MNLERFISAQSDVYREVVRELSRGRKTGHWIWFIFPQIAGLGHSSMSVRYAITSLDEARAYLDHPLLGPRLRECTRLVVAHCDQSLDTVLGAIDAMKFRSSMTLFEIAAPGDDVFSDALTRCCSGVRDDLTLALL
jgi:uncharacterized protein (DUF1810 family)